MVDPMGMLSSFGASMQQPMAKIGKMSQQLGCQAADLYSKVQHSTNPPPTTTCRTYVVSVTRPFGEAPLKTDIISDLPLYTRVTLSSFPSPGIYVTNGSVAIKVATPDACERKHHVSYPSKRDSESDGQVCNCGLDLYRTYLHLQARASHEQQLKQRQRLKEGRYQVPLFSLRSQGNGSSSDLNLATISPSSTDSVDCQDRTGYDHGHSDGIRTPSTSYHNDSYNHYIRVLKSQVDSVLTFTRGCGDARTSPQPQRIPATVPTIDTNNSKDNNDWIAWQRHDFYLAAEQAKDLGMQVLLYPEVFVRVVGRESAFASVSMMMRWCGGGRKAMNTLGTTRGQHMENLVKAWREFVSMGEWDVRALSKVVEVGLCGVWFDDGDGIGEEEDWDKFDDIIEEEFPRLLK